MKNVSIIEGDFVRVKGDSYVYEIINIEGTKAIVKDGHQKLYTIELNLLVKLRHS